jgi:N-acetyl-anhydromuramyl-L-alanine amidase AmpD
MVDLSKSIEFNFKGSNKEKKQIILAESKRNIKDYINSLKYRYNKKNPYLPNFIISKNGEIFKIMSEEKYSEFIRIKDVDKNSIIIVLENLGCLKKNPLENCYINWIGDIYKGVKVFEKNWRDEIFWDTYTNEQMTSLVNLVNIICKEFNIPKDTIGHNVKSEEVSSFKGVVSKSNYDTLFKDVNPSFDFKFLEKQLQK